MSAGERDYLDRYLEGLKRKTAPEMPDDEFFERFCAEQILKARDLDVAELASGVVRGRHDGGIDSIYLFANGRLVQEDEPPQEYKRLQEVKLHLVFIQATRTPHFEEEAIRKFLQVSEHLLDRSNALDKYAALYNDSLRAAIQRFRTWWVTAIEQLGTLAITFYYASKSGDDASVNVKNLANELKYRAEQLESCVCDVEFVNAKALIDKAKTSLRKPLSLRFSAQLSSADLGTAYVCLVPLVDYARFITQEDGQRREYILAPNVRGYLGEKGVNEQIRATLSGSQNVEFWWLNNGVTIIASEIRPSTRELLLIEPRIVNGLQTSREIYEYAQDRKNIHDDPRHVVVKVIATSDRNLSDNILKTTNSQTKIDKVYFHSTEEIHQKIEMAFPSFGLFYERTKNQYFDDNHERDRIITLPYLMQCLVAIVLRRPDQARGRPTTYGEKEYSRLFRDSDKPELYANAALLMKRVEKYLSRDSSIERNHQYNYKFYIAMCVVSLMLRDAEPYRSKIATLKVSEVSDSVLEEAFDMVYQQFDAVVMLNELDFDQVAKGSVLVGQLQQAIIAKFGTKRERAASGKR